MGWLLDNDWKYWAVVFVVGMFFGGSFALAFVQWVWPVLRRWLFPPCISFAKWSKVASRTGLVYRDWQQATFANGRTGVWGALRPVTIARSCLALLELRREGGEVHQHPKPLFGDTRAEAWQLERNRDRQVAAVIQNPKRHLFSFDQDFGRVRKTDSGTYVSDWHFVVGGSEREKLSPGQYSYRIIVHYDGKRTACSPWRDLLVQEQCIVRQLIGRVS